MPQKSKFGFIPPLELLKLWVDYGFWYVRQLALLQIHYSILAMGLRVPGRVYMSLHGGAAMDYVVCYGFLLCNLL